MKSVLHFNIKKNALLSALPYFVMMIMSLILSPLADWLNNKKILKVEFSRKLFNTIGLWGPMCALIALAYVTSQDQSSLAVALVTVAVGINAATYLGFQINHLDLAPNHSGTLMGITNCSANIMSIIAPLLVGFVLNDPVRISFTRRVNDVLPLSILVRRIPMANHLLHLSWNLFLWKFAVHHLRSR